ncbi:hypothetical protein ABFA07_019569 [Porites harrisoni]
MAEPKQDKNENSSDEEDKNSDSSQKHGSRRGISWTGQWVFPGKGITLSSEPSRKVRGRGRKCERRSTANHGPGMWSTWNYLWFSFSASLSQFCSLSEPTREICPAGNCRANKVREFSGKFGSSACTAAGR